MNPIKRFLAKTAASHFVMISFAMPGLLKTQGFVRLMNRIFSGLAPSYDRIGSRLAPESVFLGPLETASQGLKQPPERVLDLACGTGLATFRLKRLFPGARVVGADISTEMIQVMKSKARDAGLQGFFALASNSAELPFGDNRFDLVITQNAPPYPEEMVRVLRPGGRIFLLYSFVYLPLVRNAVTRRLKRLNLTEITVVRAGEGMAATARKPEGVSR